MPKFILFTNAHLKSTAYGVALLDRRAYQREGGGGMVKDFNKLIKMLYYTIYC